MTVSINLGRAALAAAAALVVGLAGVAQAAPTRVDDFQLADQNYLARKLSRMSDAKAVVLFTYASGDAVVRKDAPALMALKQTYAPKGVEFLAIASRLGETRAKVNPDAKAAGLSMPILFDYQQLVGEQLGVTRAAEAIVVNPKTWAIAYRGPVSGAGEALEALVAGKPVALTTRAAEGGAIAFPERGKTAAHANISYVNDIAPIIKAKCAACHQPGGIGPMQLTNYEQIKGFSPMIREVVRTQRMPPYYADQTVGHFADDERLTPQQIKTLVHWVEAGAPRGKGEDPLAKVKFQAPDWPLGKPDLVVEIPAIKIPATGVLDYTRPVVPIDMKGEGRWMRASTFRVTDRQVVHHILTGVVAEDHKGATANESQWGASLGGYGPGRGSNTTPKDLGVWVPPSGGIAFQNHYTPYGKATEEKTQMGLYFYPKGQEPTYVRRTFGIFDFSIVIPAGEEWHTETAYIDIPKDAIVYAFTPHAHKRGGSVQVSIRYPNGKSEHLLALPRYDFNWQYEYVLAKPLDVPAGSRITTTWTFDNSTRNPGNPDPKKTVTWGEQSWEEMLALYFHYRWVGETVAKQTPQYDTLMQGGLMMGVMDDSQDGKLQTAELRGNMGENLKKYAGLIDADKDGALSKAELEAALKLMPRGAGRRGNSNEATPNNNPAQPPPRPVAFGTPAGPGGN